METVMNLLSSQTKRDALSFFLTFLIYLPLLAWWSSHASAFITAKDKTSSELSLDLNVFHKEEPVVPQTPDELIKEKEDEPVEEIKEEPILEEPIPEEPIVEEIVPEPEVMPEPEVVLSEKPKPLIVKKPKVKKPLLKKPRKKSIKKKKKRVAKSSRSRVASQKRAKQARSSSAGKSRFIARLKAKINANKSYPRIARKRGMQGSVKVRFRITSAGKLSGLTASGARIFINSAKKAVKKAFPLSVRGVSLPMNVALTLNYRLKK